MDRFCNEPRNVAICFPIRTLCTLLNVSNVNTPVIFPNRNVLKWNKFKICNV